MKITKTLLFFAIIFLTSCEKDLYENLELQTKTPFERKFLNAKQLPAEFQNYISQNGKDATARSSSNSDDFSNAIFTPYDIISMTDDKNITNYSISFFYEDTPKNVFYNLVINVSPTGQSSKNIFKYICNPADFENFKSHNFDFKYFVGMTEISTVANNSTNKLTSKSNSGDDECPKIYIASSSDSGSSSGSGGPGDSPASGGFNTSVPGYTSPGYTENNSPGPSTGSDDHDHSECYGSNGLYWYRSGDVRPPHHHTGKMASDCPEVVPPTGYVPVNTTVTILNDLKTWIVLDRFQLQFLNSNPDILNLVYTFLNNSDTNEEEKAFAVAMVNAARIEKQIDDTLLDPCSKSIISKLKIGTQSDIAMMISRFSPSGSLFNIHMSIGTVTNSNDLAQTRRDATSNYDINMVFNEDYINGVDNPARPTDLSIAATMAHEIIHAYLISIVSEFHNCGATTICDFPALYDAYVAYQVSKNPKIIPSVHHELIATNYVNAIAATIQEFHTGNPVEFGKATQIYTDLAWGGLTKTTDFNTKYPNDPSNVNYKERERIIKRNYAEKIGSSFGEITLAGVPCPK